MKAYKVEVLIIDFDNIGEEGIIDAIEETSYPNRCISPDVKKIEARDIGEWDDDHPLNLSVETQNNEYKKLFG